MDKKEIIILIAVSVYAAYRIYQKYFRKDSKSAGITKSPGTDSPIKGSDDDYEPYSGKYQSQLLTMVLLLFCIFPQQLYIH